jgi:RNA polymerase sigma factor (sigma-70 family)
MTHFSLDRIVVSQFGCVSAQCETQTDRTLAIGDDLESIDRETLYVEFAPLVRRLVRRYGSDSELRQDLEGEIYYRFCVLVDAFDPERGVPLRPYLVRQLTAHIYTYVRSRWMLQKRETHITWALTTNCAQLSEDPTDSWLAKMAQQHVLQVLPHSIAQLPERQRKVVCWRYYDELSFEEIADVLGIRPATVRSLLRYGLANLRKQMLTPCQRA